MTINKTETEIEYHLNRIDSQWRIVDPRPGRGVRPRCLGPKGLYNDAVCRCAIVKQSEEKLIELGHAPTIIYVAKKGWADGLLGGVGIPTHHSHPEIVPADLESPRTFPKIPTDA